MVVFAVPFPSFSSVAVLLYCFSFFVLSVSISSVPCWQSSFQAELAASMVMLMQQCPHLPVPIVLVKVAVQELQKMQSTDGQGVVSQKNLLCCHPDGGSFSSDIFRTLGCQWEVAEYKIHKEEKASRKTFKLLIMCQVTNLG